MKNKKSFWGFLISTFIILITTDCNAQITDSLKYDNGFLYYHEYGSKNLPAVIVLTGGPGNTYNQLEEMAIKMSPKFRCILLEQRGTGKSIPKPFDSTTVNINLVTKDLKTLIDNLKLKKSVLLGHSWGGMLAMNFAAEYPKNVKQLILIGPGPHKDVKNGFEVFFANRTHKRSSKEENRLNQLTKLIKTNKADSLEIIESMKLTRRAYIYANPIPDSLFLKVNTERNSKTLALLWKDIIQNYDVSKTLNNYKGQIDIISGRQDVAGFFSYELKQDRPSINLHWINKSGHFPMYEQPSEFYDILYSVLEGK